MRADDFLCAVKRTGVARSIEQPAGMRNLSHMKVKLEDSYPMIELLLTSWYYTWIWLEEHGRAVVVVSLVSDVSIIVGDISDIPDLW